MLIIGLFGVLITSCMFNADVGNMFISDGSVNDRFQESMEYNKAVDPIRFTVATDTYNLLVVGDSHVGKTQNIDTLLVRAGQENSQAVIFNGDNTTGIEKDYNTFKTALDKRSDVAKLFLVGNHDLYFDGWDHHFINFGSSVYTFTVSTPVATDLFICLDTGSGTIGQDQMAWLKDVLNEKRLEYRNCIVLTHNNMFRFRRTFSTNPMIEELHVLLQLFVEFNVNMVVTSHDHKRNSGVFGNTTHLILDDFQDRSVNASYLKLHVINGEITNKFVTIREQ